MIIDTPQAWDIAYLSEILKKEKFDYYRYMKLKIIFQINKVIEGLFSIVEKIYGFIFKKQVLRFGIKMSSSMKFHII